MELDLAGADDQAAVGVEERERIVLRLRDDRADGGVLHRRRRLLADGLEAAAQDLQVDGIDGGGTAYGTHSPGSITNVPWAST